MDRLAQPQLRSNPNLATIADLYGRYLDDPKSLESSWQEFFRDLDDDARRLIEDLRDGGPAADHGVAAVAAGLAGDRDITADAATLDSLRALMLIRSYRVRGHL
jgi:2-oxoglutarate dehydrogenase E1 component